MKYIRYNHLVGEKERFFGASKAWNYPQAMYVHSLHWKPFKLLPGSPCPSRLQYRVVWKSFKSSSGKEKKKKFLRGDQ